MSKIIVRKLSEAEIEYRKINAWPIWEKETSRFPYIYDADEECLIIDGEVVVETSEGQYIIKAGDFVVFKDGLECIWDIKSPIRKYYNFP